MTIAYKFLGKERGSFLDDGYLRFSQPSALNDPQECSGVEPIFDSDKRIERVIQQNLSRILMKRASDDIAVESQLLKQRYESNPRILSESFMRYLRKRQDDALGILCLSSIWNNTLLWAHYADSHSGFCVGFDALHKCFSRFETDPTDIGNLRPVRYVASKIPFRIDDGEMPDNDLFYLKSDKWAYENEIRIIRLLIDADKVVRKGAEFNICLFGMPDSAIKELIAGACISDGLLVKLKEKSKKLTVPLYQISMSSYDLRRKIIH